MAIPFRVFDYGCVDVDFFPKHVWCVRCEDWIPIEEVWGQAYDPHVADHVQAWLNLSADRYVETTLADGPIWEENQGH